MSLTGDSRAPDKVPWVAVGAAFLVLAGVVGFLLLDRPESTGRATPPAPPATNVTPSPSLTPIQAAEQLFNNVMAASEQGDIEEARRFGPMALEAYRQLRTLDDDAHYHVGLIHVTMGDTDSAQIELDAIRSSAPNHLLGIMLAHAIAEANGDDAAASRAYEHFLSAYDAEMLFGREEYVGHRTGIDAFRTRAGAPGTR